MSQSYYLLTQKFLMPSKCPNSDELHGSRNNVNYKRNSNDYFKHIYHPFLSILSGKIVTKKYEILTNYPCKLATIIFTLKNNTLISSNS